MLHMRHRRPDGSVWVRTHPLTCIHSYESGTHLHEWDQLTYAASGAIHVHTSSRSWLVPPHRALWLPAGMEHREQFHAPVSVRMLYLAPSIARALPRHCSMVNITPLLRELIQRACRIGILDRKVPLQARLIAVLLDELHESSDVPLQLPWPSDERAKRMADALLASPSSAETIDALAIRAGASRRTIERIFLAETSMTFDEWRRRLRLMHGVQLLAAGQTVTNVADEAGYATASAFIAAFRRTFGTTPGRYAGG
jgi:AraC-like DNA-binding protein